MTMSPDSTFERHLSVEELAELWAVSVDFIRKLFLHEPGTIVFFHQRPGRRVYRTLRIPESVAARVHRRMQAGDSPFVHRNATRRRGEDHETADR